MFERYSTASRRAVFRARVEAGRVGSPQIDSEHLLLGLLQGDPTTFGEIAPALSLISVRASALRWLLPGEKLATSVDLPVSQDVAQTFEKAGWIADTYKAAFVRTEHLTLGLLMVEDSHAAVLLQEAECSLARLQEIVAGIKDRSDQEGVGFSPEDLRNLMGS